LIASFLYSFVQQFTVFPPESVKIAIFNGNPYARHEIVVEIKVMEHRQAHRQQFLRFEEVPYIGP
jgi:hypothetical protein